MIYALYILHCDNCRRESDVKEDMKEDTLKYSKLKGWTERVVPNGSTWDLCPSCSNLKMDKLN